MDQTQSTPSHWQFSLGQLFTVVTLIAIVLGFGVTMSSSQSLVGAAGGHVIALGLIGAIGVLPLRKQATGRTEALAHMVAIWLVMILCVKCVPWAEQVFKEFDLVLLPSTIWLIQASNVLARWWFLIAPAAMAAVIAESIVFGRLNSRPHLRGLAKAWSLSVTLAFAACVLFSAWAIGRVLSVRVINLSKVEYLF